MELRQVGALWPRWRALEAAYGVPNPMINHKYHANTAWSTRPPHPFRSDFGGGEYDEALRITRRSIAISNEIQDLVHIGRSFACPTAYSLQTPTLPLALRERDRRQASSSQSG
eukprot:scaffold183876_cov26-Tisochrysis_lutea.AAC.4